MHVLESFKLDGKVAWVTGAGRGIGRVCAVGLAEAGGDVACVDIDGDSAEQTAAQIRELGRRAVGIACDVTEPGQVDRAVRQTLDELGSLDVALINAGICINAPAERMTDEQWRQVVNVDLDGVFYCARAVGRVMIERGGGRIIATASMSARIVNRPQPQSAYNAAKAGVVQLCRSLACEWAEQGIAVNTISPGYTATEMTRRPEMQPLHQQWSADTPMKRLAEPDEIKGAVVFLASAAASFVTGHDLVIDGGFTCW